MFSRINRHFREAFYGIWRHFAMAFSSASAVSITLILIGAVMLISANISHITRNIEQNVEILVKIDKEASESDITRLQSNIEALDEVLKVTFSSKDNELEKFISSYGSSYNVYRGANNPMKNAFYVKVIKGDQLEVVSSKISQMVNVDSTNYGGINTVTMVTTMNSINYAVYVVAGVFSLLAVFLINNTIKITIHSREKEIAIMRHIGATNGFIRTPFVIEGIFIGLLGCIFPVVAVVVGYQYLFTVMDGYLLTKLLVMAPVFPLVNQIAVSLLGVGCVVGLIGSFVSVTRYLRFKR